MDWVSVASTLLAFLLYYNTLDAGFVYDDRRAILTNPDVLGHTPIRSLFENDFWGTPLTDGGSHGSYRPLCVATYRLNYALTGLRPWSYHFLNVLLHCMATLLVIVAARRLLPRAVSSVGTAVAGLTFAAHPIHTEAVAGVVGRADLAACNLLLLSFLVYCEHLRLRDASKNNSPLYYKQKPAALLRRHHVSAVCSDQRDTFRLSCHRLVHHLVTNIRKLLKVGNYGPTRLLSGIRHISYNHKAQSLRPRRDYECSDVDSADESDIMQWVTLAGTLSLAAAATLCKEPAITVLPVCILYDFLRSAGEEESRNCKNRWRSLCALGAGGVALLYWRLRLAGSAPLFAAADNPAARDPSLLTRILTFAYLPVFNFLLLLWPHHLSFDWSMDAIPRITSIFDGRNVSTVIFFIFMSRVTWKAIKQEFKKNHNMYPSMNNKYYKARCSNSKRSQKPGYYKNSNRPPYRMTETADRRTYYTPYREYAKKQICPCTGCKQMLTEDHTSSCRAVNNNNTMTHQSCACPVFYPEKSKTAKTKEPRRSVRVALLVFMALMVFPFVPASNSLFYVGFVVAERVLYLPSVGYCLLLGLGAGVLTHGWRRRERRSRMFACSLLLLLLAMCGRTLRRNLDWRNEESLFRSALHINPPKAYGNLGSVLSAQGRSLEAEVAFQRALNYRPNMAEVHYNLGILLQNERRYEEAIKSFEKAIHFRPSMALAYVNLGASLVADGRAAEAASALRAAVRAGGERVRDRRQHDAARVSALVQLASLHAQRSHWHKAIAAYREALDIIPEKGAPLAGWSRHSVLSMVGEAYAQLQQWTQAERNTLAALSAAPDHVPSHLAYAKLLARNSSRTLEAEMWFKRALHLAPDDPSVRDQFGMFLRDQRRVREAAEQLIEAARLAPEDSVRAASAARALREARRCRSAERWYAKAVQLNPENAESHSNLGAILHLNGKYGQAAAAYRRALNLQPGDAVTLTNLKRLSALVAQEQRNT